MAALPPLTLIIHTLDKPSFLPLSFRLHNSRRLLPQPCCLHAQNPTSADEENALDMASPPSAATDSHDASFEEMFGLKQDQMQQWCSWFPVWPGLPIKKLVMSNTVKGKNKRKMVPFLQRKRPKLLVNCSFLKHNVWKNLSYCQLMSLVEVLLGKDGVLLFVGGLSSDDRDHILDLLFDLKKGLGLNIVRYNIGGGADPDLNEYLRPFGHVPGLKPGPDRPYDWSADARQQSILLGARDRGADVFEAFSNSPPYWMTLSGSVTGNARWGQDNLNPDYDEAFVDYLTEVVKHYQEHWDLHFNYIAPFNEPVEGWWNLNKKKKTAQEGCNFSASSIERVIPKLKKVLDEKKLQTKISAFDAWSQNTVRVLLGMDEAALSAIDQINVHTYVFITSREDDAKRKQVREAAASIGKKMWMSEYGPLNWRGEDIDVALGLGRHIALDLNELQASAWCYWQALEMPGSLWGLLQTPFSYDVQPRNLVISKQYYVFMQFTKWIRPGFQVFPVATFADRFLVTANFLEKTAVLLFINESTAYRDYSYDMSVIAPWLSTDCKMEAMLFRTSATENHVQLPTMVFDFPTIMIRVNSKSVTTMVLSEANS